MPDRIIPGKRAWEVFVDRGVLDPRVVRAEVGNSWQRCKGFNVSPQRPQDEPSEEYARLDERRYQKEQLCRIARPFMRDLCYYGIGSGFQVVLTDENGYLLDVLGDSEISRRTKEVQLCAGADWSEARRGTNAIGTALVERRPIHIYAWEHYCENNQFLTCAAAPIHDPDGSVIGVLDVSGDCRQANPHTLALVVATARGIENQFRLENINHKLYVSCKYSAALIESSAEGIMAIDRSGLIREINARGAEIFGVSPAQVQGHHLVTVYGPSAPLLHVMESGREYQDQEVLIGKIGKKVRSSASVVRDEAGGIVGAVAVFREANEAGGSERPKRPSRALGRRYEFDDIVGESAVMAEAKDWAKLAARGSSTVLILGESGTGKELFAGAIHCSSQRAAYPFVAVNCAALPESLIESELFGYTDGSFTGAKKGGQPGRFESANGGSIFLDEIGDMSLSVQAKLLRVIQERKVARVGSSDEVPVDIRIIAATHKDLKAEVGRGTFREDLYYRLSVLEILVPPLRDRLSDIPELAQRLAVKIVAKLNRPPVLIEDGFLTKLATYNWPGNIREMENSIERAIVRIGDGNILSAEALSLTGQPAAPPTPARQNAPALPPPAQTLVEIERLAITEALAACGGNIVRTAARLGICRNTLYRKIEEYRLKI